MSEGDRTDARGGVLAWLSRRGVYVEPGEWKPLVLAWLYFFSLLMSYYMLRPIRETMGIARGWDDLPWLFTATLIAMIPANMLFAWVASRWPRRRFIPLAQRFFAVNLLVFVALLFAVPEGKRVWVGYCFYVWLSVFNLFVISVFWAFLADVFRPEQTKRLFGVVGVGGTIGAICGSGLVWTLAEHVNPAVMMVGSLALLEVATQAMRALARSQSERLDERREGASGAADAPAGREPSARVLEGLRLIARSPYMATIALYLLITTVTATFLYMEQGRIIDQAIVDEAERTRVFALIDMLANVATLLVQGFFTARLVRWLGIGWTLAILPTVVLAGFIGLWIAPVVWMIVAFQVARRGLHYAVARPVREMLFAPLGADAKYKSKPFIDTFIYRGGDQLAAWVPRWLAAVSVPLVWIAIPAALVWAVVGVVLGRMERRAGALREPDEAPPVATGA
ncbi:MAG TPA: MFS transporter [Phycisphaerales bacterium]|nr:MFS transporter [Phycisphaerales bacterium]